MSCFCIDLCLALQVSAGDVGRRAVVAAPTARKAEEQQQLERCAAASSAPEAGRATAEARPRLARVRSRLRCQRSVEAEVFE